VSGTDVVLSWAAPEANHDPITAYKVLIREADGDFSEEATHCNGATDSAILADAECTVPMAVLSATPYSLAQGARVLFTVASRN
jgi:hypothetical protein